MKKIMLFLMLFAFGFLASSFIKANEDSEKSRYEYCITADSDFDRSDFQSQLINPGRAYVNHVGKEYHEYNFIYKEIPIEYRHYKADKPPGVGIEV